MNLRPPSPMPMGNSHMRKRLTAVFHGHSLNIYFIIKKYKTFSVLIYSYINTSGNWKNEKLCGNTTPAGRSVFTQFRVFPIFTSVDITVHQYGKNVLYFFYNIAQRTSTKEWREIFRVDIELYQHGSYPISVQNLHLLYYNISSFSLYFLFFSHYGAPFKLGCQSKIALTPSSVSP